MSVRRPRRYVRPHHSAGAGGAEGGRGWACSGGSSPHQPTATPGSHRPGARRPVAQPVNGHLGMVPSQEVGGRTCGRCPPCPPWARPRCRGDTSTPPGGSPRQGQGVTVHQDRGRRLTALQSAVGLQQGPPPQKVGPQGSGQCLTPSHLCRWSRSRRGGRGRCCAPGRCTRPGCTQSHRFLDMLVPTNEPHLGIPRCTGTRDGPRRSGCPCPACLE